MRRRDFLTLAGASAAVWPLAARGQQAGGTKRLGFIFTLAETDPTVTKYVKPFRESLAAQGWVEGKNLVIDYRWGAAVLEAAAKAAKEIVELKPDVILATGTAVTPQVQKLTNTIPIVFTLANDPVESGLVDSLAHPGGNSTGFSNVNYSFASNELGILLDIAPGLRRAGLLLDPANPTNSLVIQVWQDTARRAGIEPVFVFAHSAAEIAPAIAQVGSVPMSGFHVWNNALFLANRAVVLSEVAKYKMPAVYGHILYGPDGGLVCYGSDAFDLFGRSGEYVGRILNGTKVGDLPVQSATKFTLIVNLKTAKAQGITIPQSVLVRADEVIE